MARKKTHEEFVLEIKEKFDNDFQVLDEYQGAHVSIQFKHICGTVSLRSPATMLNSKKGICEKCSKTVSYNTNTFKEKIISLVGIEYKVLSKYVNSKTELLFYHTKCEKHFSIIPNAFLNGTRCPHCNRYRTKDTDWFKNEIKKVFGEEYTVIGNYVSSKTNISIRHKCGEIISVKPQDILNKRRSCKKCKTIKMKNKNRENFISNLKEKYNSNIELVGKFENRRTSTAFKCNLCDTEFTMYPCRVLHSEEYPCNSCKIEMGYQRKRDELVKYLKQNTHIELISKEYKNSTDYLEFMCLNCKGRFTTCVHTIKKNNVTECRKCSYNRASKKDFKEILDYVSNTDAILVSCEKDYFNSHSKLRFKCECGVVYTTTWGHFHQRNKHRCNKCSGSMSMMERKVDDFLKMKNIPFKKEATFPDLKTRNGNYRYDFLIELDNNEKILIETDGQQHFYAIDHWGGKEALKRTQDSDEKKNTYALRNNIHLIRIPYWEINNIEYILSNILLCFGLESKKNSYDENLLLKYMVTRNWDHEEYIKRSM